MKFSRSDFHTICDQLAAADADLASIISVHGYPPFWNRPNTFETLVHIILEQQVSLASALSALNKLRAQLGVLSPEAMLTLSDDEMKACYCSRQKMLYIRHLAEALVSGRLDLALLENIPHAEVRRQLTALKGIGDWTADVYLIFVLQHADIFPIGDLAAVNALKRVKKLSAGTSKEDLLTLTEAWRPNRTIATMLLWHFYLSSAKK